VGPDEDTDDGIGINNETDQDINTNNADEDIDTNHETAEETVSIAPPMKALAITRALRIFFLLRRKSLRPLPSRC
jgi:hypothetical protein